MNGDTVAFDRLSTHLFSMDLAELPRVASPAVRPANRRRQRIVRFRGKSGSQEIFAVLRTMPYRGHELDAPPTEAQQRAIRLFFNVDCETRYQASTMLSARDYAEVVAGYYKFDTHRSIMLWISATEFILANKEIRSAVRNRNIGLRGLSVKTNITDHKPLKKVLMFCDKLITDMQGEGADVFG